jgi:hypothetical protein
MRLHCGNTCSEYTQEAEKTGARVVFQYQNDSCYPTLQWITVGGRPRAVFGQRLASVPFATASDGVELLSRLRHGEGTSQTPVIAMTLGARHNACERAEQEGCDVCFVEAVPTERLVAPRTAVACTVEGATRRRTPIYADSLMSRTRVFGIAGDYTHGLSDSAKEAARWRYRGL